MKRNWLYVIVIIALALSVWGGLPAQKAKAVKAAFGSESSEIKAPQASTSVVISQVYGGGGGTGTYLYDYVELLNVSANPVNISGWTLQYGSATGNFASSSTNIYTFTTGTSIAAGQYFLIQLGGAGTSGAALPVTPNRTTSNIAMSQSSGKLALVNNGAMLGCGATATLCTLPDARIVDSVSYGTANNAEGGVSVNNGAALANTQGGVRKSNGCQDTDNNNNDFTVTTAPVPRNSASPTNICVPVTYTSILSGNWQITSTWDLGTAPNSSLAIVNLSNSAIVTLTASATVNSLAVNAGSSLIIPNGTTLNATTLTNNGTITQTQTVGGNASVNYINTGNYHGVDITNTVGSSMGAVTVTIKGNQGCTTNLGTEPVNRCFNITPATPQPATIKFWYTSVEAANNPYSSTNAYHWGGVNGWELLTGISTSSGLGNDRWVQANVTAYSPFLLDDPLVGPETFTSPMAVTLNDFNGTPTGFDGAALLFLLGIGSALIAGLILSRKFARTAQD